MTDFKQCYDDGKGGDLKEYYDPEKHECLGAIGVYYNKEQGEFLFGVPAYKDEESRQFIYSVIDMLYGVMNNEEGHKDN